MENAKVYCLHERSVTEVPYYYSLYDYVSHGYDDDIDLCDKEGVFMMVKEYTPAFIISEDMINKYMIHGKQAEICVTDFDTRDGETIYVGITESPKIAPLMDCYGLSDDEIFANMIRLDKYLRSFVANMCDFDNQYEGKSTKKAV